MCMLYEPVEVHLDAECDEVSTRTSDAEGEWIPIRILGAHPVVVKLEFLPFEWKEFNPTASNLQ